ncbi:MAG: hypothetical protein ACD_52C00028G0002 [uncultured bacterium]|uniref:Uncharacterized protein n=1 Tax=Candidatus Woesebacteria bacterium RIFCSPHIGHO2_12_FULL_41_24 TaxID=1802510 RepID=A0A1F8AR84_9BACT|nr:MAG: hypothetical protein ACD_52C00028G0002 [uncultured bacterium]OGM13383.1 MAG: hypothetical protein A2W15_05800 [Candidatus Woesebacteria bacterium RBG_16_41_13]OGM30514.1 MAG: hypothetical protein A2873_02725 [Candidatus Woesebacteria bacterium RIFCSPHIGHO2_01_FULL_42_80]OGM35927.1 MAG: hypothetical protein A3D84_01585 [Candidatus Woesebacteria bacterium RIFCSPHIGHO2_02_FULL_42_20]OGM54181.1 MAG: hypothetical protein A3E44_00670 [Candidatus Woesebacteria bacterium RIFCSPHIGHO2_12_FULL_41
MPKKVFVAFIVVSIVSLGMVMVYLYQKSRTLEQKTAKIQYSQAVLYDQSGRNIYSYSITWNGEPVAQTADISQFKEIKSEGTKIYAFTPSNQKLLVALQGKLRKIDAIKKEVIISSENDEELLSLMDCDIKYSYTDQNLALELENVGLDDTRIKIGSMVTFNPPRYENAKCVFMIRGGQ